LDPPGSEYTRVVKRLEKDELTGENVVNKELALRMVCPDSLSYTPSQSK